MAKLYFRYGAMNSGKSTAMIQAAHNYEERGMQVLILKPKTDTKGEDKIVARIGAERKVDQLVPGTMDIEKNVIARKGHQRPDCILSDESQFFTPSQVDQLFRLAVVHGIPVLAYGIRTDFQTNSFPGSRRLLELAHSIEELKTICRCGKKAICNTRQINGKFVFDGNQVAIDGKDKVSYTSLCGACYLEEKTK